MVPSIVQDAIHFMKLTVTKPYFVFLLLSKVSVSCLLAERGLFKVSDSKEVEEVLRSRSKSSSVFADA